jgi:hypothetical protein
MDKFHEKLDRIVREISDVEAKRMKIGEFLRKINDTFEVGPDSDVSDVQMINKCPTGMADTVSVLGVDGGIVKHSFHGLDLMLLRATGVNFIYNDGKLGDVFYYPAANTFPQPKVIIESLSDIEFNLCSNIERQITEIRTTIDAMEKVKPDMIFLDGSVIPQYVFTPENQGMREKYKELVEHYLELYKKSREMKVILAGVVEDSRSTKFSELVGRRVLGGMRTELSKDLQAIMEKTKDSNLLFYALKKGERTCVFNYCNGGTHPMMKEFKGFGDQFFSFYVKTVEFDRPIKVDFLKNGNELDNANRIVPVLLNTAGHSGYGLPAVLIEADQRAKLSEKDLDMFYADLVSKVGNVSSLFKMRREMRPF